MGENRRMRKMDKWEEVDEWEKMDQYGQILTKRNTTVTELIYFLTMS